MTETTMTLDSPRDSITFTATGGDSDIFGATPSAGAFFYDDESLDSWYALPEPDVKVSKRANAHGTFGLGRVTVGAAEPHIVGKYLGLSSNDAQNARERLSAMFNDGRAIVMRVKDHMDRVESRVVWVTSFDPDWTATDTFTFDMTLVAPDARRYGPRVDTAEVGLGTPAGGLVWPLGTSGDALSVSESNLKTVASGGVESVVLSLDVQSSPSVSVRMQASMAQPQVAKSGTLRVRAGSVTGPVLASVTLADKGDTTTGDADTWSWSGSTAGAQTIVLTAQANAGTTVYSASRSISTPPTYFDWGTPGVPPTVTLRNDGNATAYPTVQVGGSGTFLSGFRITEVETGRELEYSQGLAQGSTVVINNRTRRASLNDGDVTEFFRTREWFEVPPGSTRTYSLAAVGLVTGTPTYRASMMPANL